MALCIPPDLILTVLEGVTAIIHYCLLDQSSPYHLVSKHLSELVTCTWTNHCHPRRQLYLEVAALSATKEYD